MLREKTNNDSKTGRCLRSEFKTALKLTLLGLSPEHRVESRPRVLAGVAHLTICPQIVSSLEA